MRTTPLWEHGVLALCLSLALSAAALSVSAIKFLDVATKEIEGTHEEVRIAVQKSYKDLHSEAEGLRKILENLQSGVNAELKGTREGVFKIADGRLKEVTQPLGEQIAAVGKGAAGTLQESQEAIKTYRQLPINLAESPFMRAAQGEVLGNLRNARLGTARLDRAMNPIIADVKRGGDAAADVAVSIREMTTSVTASLTEQAKRPPWYVRWFLWRRTNAKTAQ